MNDMNIPDGLPTLSAGDHGPDEGQACVMEYVALLNGEAWTDNPSCTHPLLAALAQLVNDRCTDEERGPLLVPLIGRLFGTTAGPEVDEPMARAIAENFGDYVELRGFAIEWRRGERDIPPRLGARTALTRFREFATTRIATMDGGRVENPMNSPTQGLLNPEGRFVRYTFDPPNSLTCPNAWRPGRPGEHPARPADPRRRHARPAAHGVRDRTGRRAP
jgi:hypothetical protein